MFNTFTSRFKIFKAFMRNSNMLRGITSIHIAGLTVVTVPVVSFSLRNNTLAVCDDNNKPIILSPLSSSIIDEFRSVLKVC